MGESRPCHCERLHAAAIHFNAGEFFKCHELLEDLWREQRGPTRDVYRGILQIGIGYYHALRANRRGAINVMGYGVTRLSGVLNVDVGYDLTRLVDEASRDRQRWREGVPLDRTLTPRLHRATDRA
ncbi:MAG: DUF309 domain-containing protein [Chloroflexi bacterium]|nr:DUF309 domain-containing protein [Chloroflexota bacterium]